VRGSRPIPAGKTARRWLYLIHRWMGIATCLLFAMWFISGLVMIYVPYPSLSPVETLAGAQAIDWAAVDVPPPLDHGALLLEMRDGVPVWRLGDHTMSASSHARLAPVDGANAARVAARFGHARVSAVERIERDQWSVAGGFDRHRPLWKASLADGAGTELYVSTNTGGVVQRTTHQQRFWNWLGSVPHWLYPTALRHNQPAWRQVVLWVSGPCIVVGVAGMWIGILRLRLGRRRFKGGRMTPYRGWMAWHHVAGMIGGVFLLTWIFSGWLSVDPGRLFRTAAVDAGALRQYEGGAIMPPVDLRRLAGVAGEARLVTWRGNAMRAVIVVSAADGSRVVRDAANLAVVAPDPGGIVRAARKLMPSGRLVAVETLAAPDAYWYKAGAQPVLPVLRLRFDDPARTWLHIDPATGDLLEVLDARGRLYRWLFDLLHKWDFNALTRHDWAWQLTLWGLSLAGLVISVSGIVTGWRRLRSFVD
jgi:hypothetical protein